MAKEKIEPNIILSIDVHSYRNIPMCVTNSEGNILSITFVEKQGSYHTIRMKIIDMINILRQQFKIDTIIMEQNKLFIDKIDRHPDPFVLSNITLGYGIKISLQDKYYNRIHYILELPQKEWTDKVLNKTTKYSIDLYKSHIALRDLTQDYMNIIEQNHCYKALCLSESVSFDELMNKKYWINKE